VSEVEGVLLLHEHEFFQARRELQEETAPQHQALLLSLLNATAATERGGGALVTT
jgi:hypothetical protein